MKHSGALSRWVRRGLAVLALTLTIPAAGTCGTRALSERPNVLILVMDSARAESPGPMTTWLGLRHLRSA